jgi:4-alpha-glucanotransferase
VPQFPQHHVNYGDVIMYHDHMLNLAYHHFKNKADSAVRWMFDSWCTANAAWLDDFVLFVALKDSNGSRPWVMWQKELALREPKALAEAREQYAPQMDNQRFRQWLFHMQWLELKAYANRKGVRLIGDIPIFVAHDSSDVWANPGLFYLDEAGNPTVVAGVPPDYFAENGQRWGNPLYRWDVMAQNGYEWWIQRIKATLAVVDIVRIDHFRGFEAYWEIPAAKPTAKIGKWVPGPGAAFFKTIKAALGDLPIIAEDLGLITPGVLTLRDNFGLPGMKVLQFGFGWDPYGQNPFLPHNYTPNCVVYSGTHDNNTTLGWWQTGEATDDIRRTLEAYLGHTVKDPHWDLMRLGMTSVAHTFVAPLQDVLGFGADTRMNKPGTESGNWTWRFSARWLDDPSRDRLAALTKLSARWPEVQKEKPGADEAGQDWATKGRQK